jgi:DNA-directed RNA polymerase specialized sigma24 family protein
MKSGNEDATPLLKALVLIQLEILGERPDSPKPELLLHRAGLGIADIAEMLGKNYPAIAKSLSRAKS